MQFGAYTFVEARRDPATGEPADVAKSLADVLEQIERADRVGLDVFGLGEHHRPDYAVSAPAVVLAAAAARTKRIRLTSAVTVLSSDDPVRVYQQFATLDLISGGRAEIMAGRGSFIESFPLFGYDLEDYDELFAEKLDLLLKIRDRPEVVWKGRRRSPLNGERVYPRALQAPLPVWIASGGTPQSVARAGMLGLPLAIAIIGGEPARFAPLAELYREAGRRAGVAPDALMVGINGHGFLADTADAAAQAFFAPYAEVMSRIGRERGWPPLTRAQFDQGRPARASDGRNARRGGGQNSRPSRGLRPRPLPHTDAGRPSAPGCDPALDRAAGNGRGAQGADRTGEGEGSGRGSETAGTFGEGVSYGGG